jgi:hypothetical protein
MMGIESPGVALVCVGGRRSLNGAIAAQVKLFALGISMKSSCMSKAKPGGQLMLQTLRPNKLDP